MWLQIVGVGINGSIVHEFHIRWSSSLKSCKYMNENVISTGRKHHKGKSNII